MVLREGVSSRSAQGKAGVAAWGVKVELGVERRWDTAQAIPRREAAWGKKAEKVGAAVVRRRRLPRCRGGEEKQPARFRSRKHEERRQRNGLLISGSPLNG